MRPLTRAGLPLALLLVATPASAALDPSSADEQVKQTLAQGEWNFCTKPRKPLTQRAMALCPLAKDVQGCEGFAKACADLETAPPKPMAGWMASLLAALGSIAQVLIWVLVLGLVLVLAIPLLLAFLRARRDKSLADVEPEAAPKPVVEDIVEEALATTDAEALLHRAQEHEQRGELDRALFVYLAASLRALDLRGAIRLARHVTNGEYVRACAEKPARPPLREIVREVDAVQFGGHAPTRDAVSKVAARAVALVRSAPLAVLVIALALVGCDAASKRANDDPGGDELFVELLRRQGIAVTRPPGPLATLPMPVPGEPAPTLLVDFARTPLDDDAQLRLVKWIKRGGTLILVSGVSYWPKELDAKIAYSTSAVIKPSTWGTPSDDDEDEGEAPAWQAKLSFASAFSWPGGFVVARSEDGEPFAATRALGEGRVLGVASADLMTNLGLARVGNAEAVTAILLHALPGTDGPLMIARPEDGTAPPTNPISALARAGLGPAMAHALFASILLFLAVGVRLARATPTAPPRRRAFVEHVEATGTLWSRARVSPHALATYVRWAEEHIRAHMPRGQTDPIAFLAQRSKREPEEIAALWRRAHEARTDETPKGDELKVLKQLGELMTLSKKS